jgi:hypothetical protein
MIDSNHLDNIGTETLKTELMDMLQKCGYLAMKQAIDDSKQKISDIVYNPNISGGGYNPTTKVLSFNNSQSIGSGTFQEEFVHFYQDVYYPGGISQYLGYINIEFEAKLIQDIICRMWGAGGSYFGEGANHGFEYNMWIENITQEGTVFPSYDEIKNQYWYFLQDFQQKIGLPYYNMPINNNLNPNALHDISAHYPVGGCTSSIDSE